MSAESKNPPPLGEAEDLFRRGRVQVGESLDEVDATTNLDRALPRRRGRLVTNEPDPILPLCLLSPYVTRCEPGALRKVALALSVSVSKSALCQGILSAARSLRRCHVEMIVNIVTERACSRTMALAATRAARRSFDGAGQERRISHRAGGRCTATAIAGRPSTVSVRGPGAGLHEVRATVPVLTGRRSRSGPRRSGGERHPSGRGPEARECCRQVGLLCAADRGLWRRFWTV